MWKTQAKKCVPYTLHVHNGRKLLNETLNRNVLDVLDVIMMKVNSNVWQNCCILKPTVYAKFQIALKTQNQKYCYHRKNVGQKV